MECGPGEARVWAKVLDSDPAAAPLRAASLVLPGLSGPAPPNIRESFRAASRTIGNKARGRGGRIRMVGALTDMTATTWPEASRTGADTLAAQREMITQ